MVSRPPHIATYILLIAEKIMRSLKKNKELYLYCLLEYSFKSIYQDQVNKIF